MMKIILIKRAYSPVLKGSSWSSVRISISSSVIPCFESGKTNAILINSHRMLLVIKRITCVGQKYVFEKCELLGQQLDPFFEHFVFLLQLRYSIVSLLSFLPRLFTWPSNGLVVARSLCQIITFSLLWFWRFSWTHYNCFSSKVKAKFHNTAESGGLRMNNT